MEKDRYTVKICGNEYVIASTEAPEYVFKIADMIDKKMTELVGIGVPLTSAGILSSMEFCDLFLKSQDVSNNMRSQIKPYVDDAKKAKQDLELYNVENAKLRDEVHALRVKLAKMQSGG